MRKIIQTLKETGEKRLFSYLFLFVLGFVLRNKMIPLKFQLTPRLLTIVLSFILIVFWVYKRKSGWMMVWPYKLFNSALVLFIMLIIATNNWLQNKLFLLFKRNSLGIYLYYPLSHSSIYIFLLQNKEQKHVCKPDVRTGFYWCNGRYIGIGMDFKKVVDY